jgi:hypothetical protein
VSSSIANVLQASQIAVVFYQLSNSIVNFTSGLLRLQLSSNYFQLELLALIKEFLKYNSTLPFSKFNYNRTSGLLRLRLFSTFFLVQRYFFTFMC